MANKRSLFPTFPQRGIIAEVGVFNGDSSRVILKACNPRELWLIDVWSPVDEKSTEKAKEHFFNVLMWAALNTTEDTKIRLIRDQSLSAAAMFPNEYFDCVYIDGDHRYGPVRDDLVAWTHKTKKDGFICGDDFILDKPSWEGVHKAVIEYVLRYVIDQPEILDELRPLEDEWELKDELPKHIQELVINAIDVEPYPERTFKIPKCSLRSPPSVDLIPAPYEQTIEGKEIITPLITNSREKKRMAFLSDVLDMSEVLHYDAGSKR